MTLRELLSGPEKWTKKAIARTASGNDTDPESDRAVCWCLRGGTHKLDLDPNDNNNLFETIGHLFPDRISSINPFADYLVMFNDHPDTTWEDVNKVLDEAGV